MKPFSRLNKFFGMAPIHLALLVMIILWLLPTLGVFVTSFRTREDVRTTGWWTAFLPSEQEGVEKYATYCAECHGADGALIPTANLSDPALLEDFPRSNRLLIALRREVNGSPHLQDPALPEDPNDALDILAPILSYLSDELAASREAAEPKFTATQLCGRPGWLQGHA